MKLSTLLAQMIERNASDLHLAVGVPPIFRQNGFLTPAPPPNLSAENLEYLLKTGFSEEKLVKAQSGADFSATLHHETRTFHCRVFRDRGTLSAAIRLVPERIYSLEEMQLPPVFEKLTHCRRGLILVAGPTGSGKTTTLVSMLEQINMTRSERILTLESPLNYVLGSKLSLISQRVVGEDVDSYESGLRSAMLSDPDVLFVDSVRTSETARLVLEAAEAGHLVFAQMTANTVAEAIHQLLGLFGKPRDAARRLLAQVVQAVIAQRLLMRDDAKGRVAANEILLATPRIRQMIRDGQTKPKLLELAMEANLSLRMQTMDDALLKLYQGGSISRETALSHLKDKARLTGPGF